MVRPRFHLRRAVACAVLASMIPGVAVADPGSRQWVRRYDSEGSAGDRAVSLGVSPNGSRIYVAGASFGSGSDPDVQTTIAYSNTGDRLWTADQVHVGVKPSVAASSDGSVVYVANRNELAALGSADGSPLWTMAATPGDLIAVSPTADVVFAAGIDSDCLAVRAYDQADGSELWTGVHCFSATSFATALAVSPDGSRVFATGIDNSDSGGQYYTGTVSFNASTGHLAWFRGFGKCCSSSGDDVAVSDDGSVVYVSAYNSTEWARIAYRASDGHTLWQHSGGAGGLGMVAGGNRVFIGTDRFALAAFRASDGDRVWNSRYVGPSGKDVATDIGIGPGGGRVYLIGASNAPGNGPDFATVAFGAAGGSIRWSSRYNGPGDGRDVPKALAVSPNGSSLYVVGGSVGDGTGSDYATASYQTNEAA